MSGFDVAVVIPLFNKAGFIRATLQSVLAQSHQPSAVIIIDDGSSDGSVAAIADLIGGPVRLVAQANVGPGPARNRGIAEANAEWIAFIDGDDLWAPDHLATLGAITAALPSAAVVTGSHVEVRSPAQARVRLSAYRVDAAPRLIDYFAESAGQARLWTSATAVRRSALLASGGFGAFFPGEDVDLWVRLALDHPIALSERVTAAYLKDTGGLMDQGQQLTEWRFGLPPHLKSLEARFDPNRHAALASSIARYRANYFLMNVRQSIYRARPDVARKFIDRLRGDGVAVPNLLRLLVKMPAPILRAAVRARRLVRRERH